MSFTSSNKDNHQTVLMQLYFLEDNNLKARHLACCDFNYLIIWGQTDLMKARPKTQSPFLFNGSPSEPQGIDV